jgi:hypothetical protein
MNKNKVLQQAREVYKNRECGYYLETIRKTADELEITLEELKLLKRNAKRYEYLSRESAKTREQVFEYGMLGIWLEENCKESDEVK